AAFSHRPAAATHLAKDFPSETKLFVQLGGSRGRSRVHLYLQVLREGFAINNKIKLVDTRCGSWSSGSSVGFVFLDLFRAPGTAPPEVPDKSVHAGSVF